MSIGNSLFPSKMKFQSTATLCFASYPGKKIKRLGALK